MAAIGADVMAGFPGETERHFEESKAFIEALPFTYLHVFTYSERPGTPAAAMPGAVPMEARRERSQILREISERKNREFRLSQVGRTVQCVTLETPGLGMSGNYLTVELNQWSGANRMLEARVGAITPRGVREQGLPPVL